MTSIPNLSRPFERGATTVEMALVAVLFFTLLFGIVELGRAMYLWNTAQQITRQAARDAIVTDFTDATAMNAVRQNAIFRTTAGSLVAGAEITDASIRISYYSLDSDEQTTHEVNTNLTCPTKVLEECTTDPHGAGCIRFVQVSLCDPANTGSCDPVKYQPMVLASFIPGFSNLNLPRATVTMPAESLGFRPSASSC